MVADASTLVIVVDDDRTPTTEKRLRRHWIATLPTLAGIERKGSGKAYLISLSPLLPNYPPVIGRN